MGELHLEIIVDRMKREFKVEANVGKPQVAYRETIRGTVEQEGKFVRQSGGRGQYGHVWLKIEPQPSGKGYEFVNGVVGGTRAARIRTGGRQGHPRGLRDRRHRGLPGGGRQGDPHRRLLPRRRLLRDGVQDRRLDRLQGGLQESPAGAARAHHESGSRHARGILGRHHRRPESAAAARSSAWKRAPSGKAIASEVPLSEMFGYATTVRSMSQGRATFTMEFSKYAEVPPGIRRRDHEEVIIRSARYGA